MLRIKVIIEISLISRLHHMFSLLEFETKIAFCGLELAFFSGSHLRSLVVVFASVFVWVN